MKPNELCEAFRPSDFIAAIAHELKTPLNAIIAFSQILCEENQYNISLAERTEYLKDINDSANNLNELVQDLLDTHFITSGNFSVDLSKEIEIENLITRSIRINHDFALRRGISIEKEIAADIGSIRLDMKRMKQIMANLISNSIKYSPEKTKIRIVVENIFTEEKKYLQISIHDQGFGMTPEQIQTAFEKYKTIQNPNSGKVDSLGLGLPIVKQLVELQNGGIKVKSEIGKGSSFILKFPYMI